MAQVFLFHGIGGNPGENWFPWLKEKLEAMGHTVTVPQFPSAAEPKLSEWLMELEKYKEEMTEETVLVGHSLGASLALHVLEKRPAKAAFLVAGFVSLLGGKFDERIANFLEGGFDWDTIRKNCSSMTVLYSDNDPYVPVAKSQEVLEGTGGEGVLVPGGGHLSGSAGYNSERGFDVLLEKMKEIL